MNAANKKRSSANRRNLRTPVVPLEIKGILLRLSDSQIPIPFLIWDLSTRGLGIWSAERLKPREKISIKVSAPHALEVECIVVWCENRASYEGFRCGLQTMEENKELTALYEQVSQEDNDEEE